MLYYVMLHYDLLPIFDTMQTARLEKSELESWSEHWNCLFNKNQKQLLTTNAESQEDKKAGNTECNVPKKRLRGNIRHTPETGTLRHGWTPNNKGRKKNRQPREELSLNIKLNNSKRKKNLKYIDICYWERWFWCEWASQKTQQAAHKERNDSLS